MHIMFDPCDIYLNNFIILVILGNIIFTLNRFDITIILLHPKEKIFFFFSEFFFNVKNWMDVNQRTIIAVLFEVSQIVRIK